ncbi:MAG: hypothetical protein R8G33_04930 [Gammaproteobacteria bacterium]|nr:hypothetical protein [Gammaproteobacteria bacterium]
MSSQKNKKEHFAVIGIPWYSERSWNKMKDISEDQDNFHASYQIWLAHADKSVVILTNRGKLFERLKIDPTSYSWWCKNQSIPRDKESRRLYIKYLLENKISQQEAID